MRKLLAVLLLAVLVSGCAWSRGRVRTYGSDGEPTADQHCWSVVLGTGRLGSVCNKDDVQANTQDTGSLPAAEQMGAMLGVAIRTASGLPPVPDP